VTATVIMVPVVLLALLFVVQFSLAYYARTVLAGAAQDGAVAGARQGASPDDGAALTNTLISESAGSLIESPSSIVSTDGETVTVRSTAKVVSLLPFFGSITVSATGAAQVEQFEPQGAGP
jgi:Flp pilus assembly protein TadG